MNSGRQCGNGAVASGHGVVYESRFVRIPTSFTSYSLWDQRTQHFQNFPHRKNNSI